MKNILHLSDFHVSDLPIGKGNSAHDLDIILSALISDIRGEFTGKKFDTIFITGDLAYHGRNAEYRIFQIHVIDILIRDLGVGRDNIFICPGNHDVDLKERSLAETMATGNSDNNTVMEGFWKTITQDEGQKHLGSLNAYHSWVSKNGNLLKRTGVFDVFTVKDGSNGVIGIISLNTAILANGGDLDHGKLRYPVEALEEAVKAIPVPNNGIIALIHHPVDWMARADRERLSKWLTGNVSMAFFGHLHEPDVSQEFSLNDITIRIQAGSFDRNSRQVGYNAIILDQENSLNTGTIFFRLMDCGRDGLRPGKSKFEKWIDRSRDGQFIFDLSDQIKFDTNEFSSSAGRLSDQIDEELLINVGQMGTKKKIVDIFDTPRLSLEEIKVIDYYENNSNNGEAKDLSDIESIASTEEIEFELIAKPSKNYLIRGTKNQGKTTLLKYIHYSHLRALEQKNYEMITVYINFDVESKVTYDHILTLACNQYETNNNRGMFTNKIKDFIKHGKVIFLIDNVHWNGNKFSELKQFIERCPGNKFLMCADDSAYSWGKSSGQAKNLQLGADTDIVSLLPLRRKNLRAMIAKFTGQEEDNVDEIFKTITKTIKSSYLPNNNFVYTVLCEIYLSKGRLDAVLTEADIIENYIEILLKKHCELLLKDDKKAPYKTILNFLGYFCVAMFNKHITAMLKIEFEMLILEYNKLNFFPYNLESYEKPLLDSGVLRINSNDEYYFSQRCFFDFACSAYVDSNDAFKSTVLSEEHYLNADKVIEYYSAGGGKNNTLLIDMLLKRVEDAEKMVMADFTAKDSNAIIEIRNLLYGVGAAGNYVELVKEKIEDHSANRDNNDDELDKVDPLIDSSSLPTDIPLISRQNISVYEKLEMAISLTARVIRNSVHLANPEYRKEIHSKIITSYFNLMGISMYLMKKELAPGIVAMIKEYLQNNGQSKEAIALAERKAHGYLTVFMAFIPRIVQKLMSTDLGTKHQEPLIKELIFKHRDQADILNILRMYCIDNRFPTFIDHISILSDVKVPYVRFSLFLKIGEMLKYDYKLTATEKSKLKTVAGHIRKSTYEARAAISYIQEISMVKEPQVEKKQVSGKLIPVRKWESPPNASRGRRNR